MGAWPLATITRGAHVGLTRRAELRDERLGIGRAEAARSELDDLAGDARERGVAAAAGRRERCFAWIACVLRVGLDRPR